jgi:hypothetical protein
MMRSLRGALAWCEEISRGQVVLTLETSAVFESFFLPVLARARAGS